MKRRVITAIRVGKDEYQLNWADYQENAFLEVTTEDLPQRVWPRQRVFQIRTYYNGTLLVPLAKITAIKIEEWESEV